MADDADNAPAPQMPAAKVAVVGATLGDIMWAADEAAAQKLVDTGVGLRLATPRDLAIGL